MNPAVDNSIAARRKLRQAVLQATPTHCRFRYMATLQDFIHLRIRELSVEEQAVRQKLDQIETERTQLRAAAQAAGLHFEPAPEPAGTAKSARTLDAISDEFADLLGRPRRVIPVKTIKEAVVEVLADVRHGLTALEILDVINRRFDTDYPRTSLSPQLSRLKAEGLVVREGMNWRLPQAPEKIEPAQPTSGGTTERAQYPETNSATVKPVEEVAHDNMKTTKPNVFG